MYVKTDVARSLGAEINQQGGIYIPRKAYDYRKKSEVAARYERAKEENGGPRHNIRALSRQCGVGRRFVDKVEKELEQYGRVLDPGEVYRNREGPIGPGSKAIDEQYSFVIHLLYHDEPSRTLSNYAQWLEYITGTAVCESTVSLFFKEAFPYSGNLCQPNIVPYDKFRPSNLAKATEYLVYVAFVDPRHIKFGDEKLLKGRELFNRRPRRNLLTGVVPPVLAPPDFRNTTYAITGFCGIDTDVYALFFSIHESNNDATQFALDLEETLEYGVFKPGDILVLDNANAAYHCGGENSILEYWLWSRHGVFLLFLPPCCPELNPIELVWNTMVKRMKRIPPTIVSHISAHAAVIAAHCVLADVTHEDVLKMYKHSGVV
ncbi:hypothetical protein ACHAWF_009789 [Thalassiosira exigua]